MVDGRRKTVAINNVVGKMVLLNSASSSMGKAEQSLPFPAYLIFGYSTNEKIPLNRELAWISGRALFEHRGSAVRLLDS